MTPSSRTSEEPCGTAGPSTEERPARAGYSVGFHRRCAGGEWSARRASYRGLGGRAPGAGFTFLELMVVLVLLGIFFSFLVPRFDGFTPKYRLRSAARRVGTKIEGHRLLAMTRGVWLGIRYTMNEEETYYELLRPPPPDYPTQPVEERLSYAKERLPTGVEIRSVQIRGSAEVFDVGSVLVLFSPTGTSGSHAVTLVNNRGQTWTVELNAITGTVDFRNTESAGFEDFEG